MGKPVILITGYLGSGKTTFLNELLRQERRKIALVVNDMGSINVDARLLREKAALQMDSGVIELSNGCICCTLREEFMAQLEELAEKSDAEAIFVEASGISDPSSIAEAFLIYGETTENPGFYLSTIVTVVDCDRVYHEFLYALEAEGGERAAGKPAQSAGAASGEESDRPVQAGKEPEAEAGAEAEAEEEEEDEDPDIINLIMDQIEFCNVILLNKCDLLPEEKLAQVERVLRRLQTQAPMIRTVQGRMDAGAVIGTEPFDFAGVMNSSAIQRALAGGMKKNAEHDEYGIVSFVYEAREPLDYDRFMEFIGKDYPEEIIRAKGYLWFDGDDIHVQLFEQAGRNASVTELSNWVAALPEEDRQAVFDNYPEVSEDWDETYGDRMNQIVFIGRNLDREAISARLARCAARIS